MKPAIGYRSCAKTHLALQNAKTALKDVHDGVVDSLPLVDHLVGVHTDDDKGGRVILAIVAGLAGVDGLLLEPAMLPRVLLLSDHHLSQKLNVATREEIKASIHVDDPLTSLRASWLDERPRVSPQTCAGDDILELVLAVGRLRPDPDVSPRCLSRLVGGVQPHTIQHGLAVRLALVSIPGPLFAGEDAVEVVDEMGLGAEQHAADEVGGGDAGGALDDLEAAGGLDEAVAVVAVAVGGDVVAVDDVLAAVVGYELEVGDVGGIGDGAGDPAAGVGRGNSSKGIS